MSSLFGVSVKSLVFGLFISFAIILSATSVAFAQEETQVLDTPVIVEEISFTESPAPVEETAPVVEAEPAPIVEEVVVEEETQTIVQEIAPDVVEELGTPEVVETTDTTVVTETQTASAAASIASPIIWTDKQDYFPGETVSIFGKFFAALQNIVFVLVGTGEDGNTAWTDSWTTTTTDGGELYSQRDLPNFYVPLYLLAANSETGEVIAEHEFTDNKVLSVSKTGAGTGTVTSTPIGINCGVDCNESFSNDEDVTLTATPSGGSSVGSWTVPAVFTTISGCTAGATTCRFELNNNAATVSVSFNTAVVKTNPTLSTTNSPQTYTGSPIAATVTGSVAGVVSDIKYNGSSVVPTDAGVYNITADFVPTDTVLYNNLEDASAGTFTISQAASVTTVTCPTNVTYTGSALTPCSATVTGVGGLNQALTVSYTNNTNAGIANGSASFAGDTNHTGSSDDTDFTVDKADSTTVVSCPVSVAYTGVAQTPCSTAVTGAGGLNLTPAPIHSNNTNVGTASAAYTYAGDTNYNGSADTENFAITQVASATVISCPNLTEVYTGAAIEPCTATVTGAGGLNTTAVVTYDNNIDVGTATAHASYGGDANHSGSTAIDVTFDITPAQSTTVVSCPANATYTGLALTPCSASVTGAGGLNEVLVVDYTDNTNAGLAGASATFAGDLNHVGSSDSESFTIDQASSITTVTCPVSQTYSGVAQEPCTAAATGAGGLNTPVSVTHTNNVNVGTANASATFAGDSNHTGSNGNNTFEITKADAVCTINGYSDVYDTFAHGATGECTGVNDEVLAGVNLGASFTNVPGGPANWTFTDVTGNYNDESDSVEIEITKADAECTISGYTGVYDAAAQGATGTCSGIGAENAGTLDLGDEFTDVPGGTANWSLTGNGNYNNQDGSVEIEISQADADVTVTGYTGTYDGAAHGATGSAAGIGLVDLSSGLSLGDSFTDVPGGTANWTFEGGTNYLDESGSVGIVINQADADVTVTPYSVTYDGNAHTAIGTATGIGGADLSSGLDLSATTHTDAGTYNGDVWSFEGGTNYLDENGTVDNAIGQASSVTVIDCPVSVEYNGDAQVPCTANVTGVGGLDEAVAVLHGNNTNVGTATADATFGGDINHTGSTDSDTFEITQKPASVVVDLQTKVYGEADPAFTGILSGFVAGDGVTASYARVAGEDVGTYEISATLAPAPVLTNYDITNTPADLTITEATLTVTPENKTVQYSDATPDLTTNIAYNAFVGGDTAADLDGILVCTTTRTVDSAADEYPITCSGQTSDNYTIVYEEGTLAVEQEDSVIDYTGAAFVFTAGPTITTAPMQLSAKLTQDPDGELGDLSLARVTFTLHPVGGGGNIVVSNVAVSSTGDALANKSVPVGEYDVTVQIAVGNLYWTAAPEMASIIVALGTTEKKVTGGGWIPDASSVNGKDNIGFTVYYNKNGAPKGNLLFMYRGTDGYNYKLKSNSWAKGGLSFTGVNTAYFSGKATLEKIDRATGLVVSSDGSYTFQINIKDGGTTKPTTDDTISMTIFDGSKAVWKQLGTPASQLLLGGGNLVVHSK